MAETKILTIADNGSRVVLKVGDELVFELEENPTTGYRWQPDIQGDTLEPASDEFDPGEKIGAGGKRRLYFLARHAGQATISLKLIRQWDPAEPLNTITVNITVSK